MSLSDQYIEAYEAFKEQIQEWKRKIAQWFDKLLHPGKYQKLKELEQQLNDLSERSEKEVSNKKKKVKTAVLERKQQHEAVIEAQQELDKKNQAAQDARANLKDIIEGYSNKILKAIEKVTEIRNPGNALKSGDTENE